MAWRDLLGRIDCPHCGTKDGMKITEDRAGNPFGNCDAECHGQLRIGDKDFHRVRKFYALHPHIKRCGKLAVTVTGEGNPVTVTETKKPVTVTEVKKQVMPGLAAATTEPVGVELAAKPKKLTYAEELHKLVGGMH